MTYQFTTLGALIGLTVAIILIIKKVQPAYSLILGALVGGIVGGGGLLLTVSTMITGSQSMMSSVLRIITSGILAGTLIKTGSAEKIAEVIVTKLGEKRALISIAIATMIICTVGVFIDIAVITVAPIALAIGKKAQYNKAAVLLAMIGGGKAGNIISPNPNTIAVSEAFKVDLTSMMMKNISCNSSCNRYDYISIFTCEEKRGSHYRFRFRTTCRKITSIFYSSCEWTNYCSGVISITSYL